MNIRVAAAVALVGFGLWYTAPTQDPAPAPGPPLELDLRGAFVSETAADDAALVAALADSIADCLEWDGQQPQPVLRTGVAMDELRTRARECLVRGVSLGDRHPKVREIVGDYLDGQVGNDGGELTPTQRDAWCHAYRQIARACRAAISP